MHKHIKTGISAILGAALLLTGTLMMTACTNDPIFSAIEQEVKLKDPSIIGSISSLVVVGTDIYTTNGRIYKRTDGQGSWNKVGLPYFRCAGLATDGTNLYGLFQNADYQIVSFQMFDGSVWAPVVSPASIVRIASGRGRVFGFAQETEGFTAYSVTALTATAITGATALAIPVGSAVTALSDYFATTAGVYDAAGTNLTCPGTTVIGITTDGTDLFALDAGSVYQYKTGVWQSAFNHNVGSPTCISWLGAGKNLLLISGAKGYGEVILDPSNVMTANLAPGASDESSVSTTAKDQYTNSIALWNLTSIYAVTSPVPAGDGYVVYAAISNSKYEGLWAYYSASRNEWNRE